MTMPMHIETSINKWFSQFGVKQLDWPTQCSDLKPIQHIWDELERRQRARPYRPTSMTDLNNALVAE